MRPALSRVAGVGNVEVLSSDTREIEVIADPARLAAAGLTIGDVADALAGRQHAAAGRHATPPAGCSTSCSPRACGKASRTFRPTPLVVKGGTTIRVADVATVQAGAPDRTMLISGDGKVAANISVSQQVGANILDVRAGVETRARRSRQTPAGRA